MNLVNPLSFESVVLLILQLVVVFLFFFLIWLLSNENTDRHRAIRRV